MKRMLQLRICVALLALGCNVPVAWTQTTGTGPTVLQNGPTIISPTLSAPVFANSSTIYNPTGPTANQNRVEFLQSNVSSTGDLYQQGLTSDSGSNFTPYLEVFRD